MKSKIHEHLKDTIVTVSKKVSIIALMVITMASAAFAGDNNTLDFKGASYFKKTYPEATKVAYQVKKDFTQVTFTWKNMDLQAFFDREGNFIGTSRKITTRELPLSYLININKEYDGYTITEAIEFDREETGMSYYVTVTNSVKTYILNISADGNISVFKKMKN